MFDPEAPSPDQRNLNQHVKTFSVHLANRFSLPELSKAILPVEVGNITGDCLERVTDRTYCIQGAGDHYTLNGEDFGMFADELDYVFESHDQAEVVAEKLFVGMGIAGTALREMLGRSNISSLKEKSYARQVNEFLTDHSDIEEAFVEIFADEGLEVGMAMTSELSDERVVAVNGLRASLALLYGVNKDLEEYIGVGPEELQQKSRLEVQRTYEREIIYYLNIAAGLNQTPKSANAMFFNALPAWVIAASTPMSLSALSHFASEGWRRD